MIPVYRTDSYLRSLTTTIDAVTDDGAHQLVTCREALFAEGGGQPRDYGTVSSRGECREVLDLVKHKGDIRLRIEAIPGLQKGDPAACELDFVRRYAIMRLHSAQHAFAGVLRGMLPGYGTRGMAIDEQAQACAMRFVSDAACTPEAIVDACERMHGIIAENRKISAVMHDSIESAAKELGPIYRPGDPSVTIRGRVRMIVIDGLDANACGGTHVSSTAEIIAVTSTVLTRESPTTTLRFTLAPPP